MGEDEDGRGWTGTDGHGLRTGTDGTDGDGRGWTGADGAGRMGADTDRTINEAKKIRNPDEKKNGRHWFQAPFSGPIFAPGKRRPSSSVFFLRS